MKSLVLLLNFMNKWKCNWIFAVRFSILKNGVFPILLLIIAIVYTILFRHIRSFVKWLLASKALNKLALKTCIECLLCLYLQFALKTHNKFALQACIEGLHCKLSLTVYNHLASKNCIECSQQLFIANLHRRLATSFRYKFASKAYNEMHKYVLQQIC